MLLFILAILIAYAIYLIIIKPMSYWKKRGVACQPSWPILGNMAPVIFRKRSFVEIMEDFYNEYPEKRYNGVLAFIKPQLVVRDLELIKQITIKDFDNFINRSSAAGEDAGTLISKSLGMLTGQKWRDMRSTLSPAFTSSKMRFMFSLISDCAEQFVKYFQNQKSTTTEVDMKDICCRFTNDAIATAAFGVTVNSLKDRDNEFFVMGKYVTNFTGLRSLKLILMSMMPKLLVIFKIDPFPKSFSQFFTKIVKETIAVRETKGVVRPDMIHLLLEARRGKLINEDHLTCVDAGFAVAEDSKVNHSPQKIQLTDDDITAQAMLFFFAGFESVSTLMCFVAHELAVNPEIQKTLQNELDETLKKCKGKITYEALLGAKYLDMVISETLRKWPAAPALDRMCAKDFVLTPKLPDEKPIIIEKGTTIIIPVIGLHHDPKYFSNPEKFDPERFNEKNKSNILPFSYMPFGVGPRNCIASRYALMEMKILFFHLLTRFDIVPVEKTVIPLVLNRKSLVMIPEGGFWFGLRERNVE